MTQQEFVPTRGTLVCTARDGVPVYSDFQPETPVPPKLYYVLGSDKLYRVDSYPGFADAVTHVEAAAALLPFPSGVKEVARFTGPKLPYSEYLITVKWYRYVMKKHHNSEALLVYHISSQTGLPMAVSPSKYEVSAARVKYIPEDFVCERCRIMSTIDDKDIDANGSTHLCCPICWDNDKPAEWNAVNANLVRVKYWGGSHSHNTMGAFASGTDIENEKTLPGVHLIFGYLDRVVPDLYAAMIVAQKRFELKDGAIAQVVEFPAESTVYPERWQECVVHAPTQQVVVAGPHNGHLGQWGSNPHSNAAPAAPAASAAAVAASKASKSKLLTDYNKWSGVLTRRIGDSCRGWDEPSSKVGGTTVDTTAFGDSGPGGNGVSGR